jgi:peptide deformylase
MALLEVRVYPDPILRTGANPVEEVDREIRKLADDMAETMYDAPGIGLAANQVGESRRLVVLDLQHPEDETGLIVLVNPDIVAAEGEFTWEEGCLSVPGFFANVKRHNRVTVRALNLDGNTFEITAEGLLAIALQHEIDHLEGRLFVDRLGLAAKESFKRKWKRRVKEAEEQGKAVHH